MEKVIKIEKVTSDTLDYRRAQLSEMFATHDVNRYHNIKITGSFDNTNFMLITEDEALAITKVLLHEDGAKVKK